MATWNNKIKLKHLFTNKEDHKSVKESMKAIADEIKKNDAFILFDTKSFYKIPAGDGVITPIKYANILLDRLYNFADDHRIWID